MNPQPRVLRVALTGGIATGKSSCRTRFAALGAKVIDADDLARAAVAPGSPALAAVVTRFGAGVLEPDGTLNRPALARLVFADDGARRDLEAVIHPPVYAAIEDWFRHRSADQPGTVAIADIPLLYESSQSARFDRVVVAACSAERQMARLTARDHLSEGEARQRLEAQMSIERKRELADYVIDTEGTHEETDRQVTAVWKELVALAGEPESR